jgi:hypothetical protein
LGLGYDFVLAYLFNGNQISVFTRNDQSHGWKLNFTVPRAEYVTFDMVHTDNWLVQFFGFFDAYFQGNSQSWSLGNGYNINVPQNDSGALQSQMESFVDVFFVCQFGNTWHHAAKLFVKTDLGPNNIAEYRGVFNDRH